MFGLRNAVDQEQKTETKHASGFHSRETPYLNAFMLIYFLTFNTYKYAFPLFYSYFAFSFLFQDRVIAFGTVGGTHNINIKYTSKRA